MKCAGQIENLPRSYRGFGITQTYWDGRDGSRKRCWVLAIYSDFADKGTVKEYVQAEGGNWCPSGRFWWVPLTIQKTTWQEIFELATAKAKAFAEDCPVNLPFELACSGEQGASLLQSFLERSDAEAILKLERLYKHG